MKKRKIIIVVSLVLIMAVLIGVISNFVWKKCFKPLGIRDYNISYAHRIAELADILEDEEALKNMRKRLERAVKRLDKESVSKLGSDARDAYEFLWLCDKLSLSVDRDFVVRWLSEFYVEERNVFYNTQIKVLEEQNVEINKAAIWTFAWTFLRDCPQILDYEEFSYREGLLREAESFIWQYPEDSSETIWGSGGAVIMTLWYLAKHDGVDYSYLLPEDVEEWYTAWAEYIPAADNINKDDYGVSLLGVALGKEEKRQPLQDQFNKFKSADNMDINALTYVRSYIEYVDISQNEVFAESLRQRIRELSKTFEFIYVD